MIKIIKEDSHTRFENEINFYLEQGFRREGKIKILKDTVKTSHEFKADKYHYTYLQVMYK